MLCHHVNAFMLPSLLVPGAGRSRAGLCPRGFFSAFGEVRWSRVFSAFGEVRWFLGFLSASCVRAECSAVTLPAPDNNNTFN